MASRVTFPKVLAAGGAVGFGYYLYMRQHWFPDPRKQAMKTTGVENIEARYTAGGGAPDHQPGTATKIGEWLSTPQKEELDCWI